MSDKVSESKDVFTRKVGDQTIHEILIYAFDTFKAEESKSASNRKSNDVIIEKIMKRWRSATANMEFKTEPKKCSSKTSNGKPCQSFARKGDIYCHNHPGGVYNEKKDGISKIQCRHKTHAGKTCSRNALEGIHYCKTHKDIPPYEETDDVICMAITKLNKRCTRKVTEGKYCGTHINAIKPVKQVQCEGEKTNKEQCTRRAKEGQKYCATHMHREDDKNADEDDGDEYNAENAD